MMNSQKAVMAGFPNKIRVVKKIVKKNKDSFAFIMRKGFTPLAGGGLRFI